MSSENKNALHSGPSVNSQDRLTFGQAWIQRLKHAAMLRGCEAVKI